MRRDPAKKPAKNYGIAQTKAATMFAAGQEKAVSTSANAPARAANM